jgi:hypothetical protein
MNTLIKEYKLNKMGKFRKVLNSDDILKLAHYFWYSSELNYRGLEPVLLSHILRRLPGILDVVKVSCKCRGLCDEACR